MGDKRMNPKAIFGAALLSLSLSSAATVTPFFSAGADCSGPSGAPFVVGQSQQVSLCVSTTTESVCGSTLQVQSATSAESDRFRIIDRIVGGNYPNPNSTLTYPISITNPAQSADLGSTVNSSAPPAPAPGQLLATLTLVPQPAATNSSYTLGLSPLSAIAVENSNCFGSPTDVPIAASFTLTAFTAANTARLANLSTRGQVLTGNEVMIAGFVIGGSTPKTVVINVAGPSLANFGVANPLANPTLTLVRSSDNAVIATNDDWQSASNAAQIQASGFAPSNALEPAIMMTLAPGAYTAIVQGVGGGTGTGLVGVFEVDHPEAPLVNISTRGKVLTGNDVMIGGFVIQGAPRKVVINVAGPSLANFGIANPLANPMVTLVRSSDNAVIEVNDNWQSASNAAQIQASGFAPSNPLEPAILITLAPGAYTAIVQGSGGGTGVALIGVFAAP